jgi:predicted RNA-binding protein
MSEISEIEVNADKLYYTIIGNYKELKNIVSMLNDNEYKYIIHKINIPIANLIDTYQNIMIDKCIEKVQCSILCGITNINNYNNIYCLLKINNNTNILNFFEILFRDNKDFNEPEKFIMHDINKNKLNMEVKSDNIKLADIIGINNDILVYFVKTDINNRNIKKLLNIINK